MRPSRQPASVTTWIVRLAAICVVVLGADWALGQRQPAAHLPTDYSAPLTDGTPSPRTLELISASVVEPAAAMERRHRERIEPLTAPLQASGIRFADDTATMIGDTGTVLDRVASLLARHAEATTVIRISGREYSDASRDRILKRERGRAVIAALVQRGMPFSRLSIETDNKDAPWGDAHRVSLDVDIGTNAGG